MYECNVKCECKGGCSNSVVQAGIVHRLQLFHTGKPQLNWGLRSLDDIPMGTFVCSYFGHVYTEMGAEKVWLLHLKSFALLRLTTFWRALTVFVCVLFRKLSSMEMNILLVWITLVSVCGLP